MCFVKPTYCSYVYLLNIYLSYASPSAPSTTHSEHNEDPLQELLSELNIEHVDWNVIEVVPADIDPNDDELHVIAAPIDTPAAPEPIVINIPGQAPIHILQQEEINVPWDDQVLIDIDFLRLTDNPQDMWWVSDLPPSPYSSRNTGEPR